MKQMFAVAFVAVISISLAGSSVAMAATIHHKGTPAHRRDRHSVSNAPAAGTPGRDLPVTPGSIGSLYGIDGAARDADRFANAKALGVDLPANVKLGSALVGGGERGEAYADYMRHYNYYKYDYCRVGSAYIWTERRCVAAFDPF